MYMYMYSKKMVTVKLRFLLLESYNGIINLLEVTVTCMINQNCPLQFALSVLECIKHRYESLHYGVISITE